MCECSYTIYLPFILSLFFFFFFVIVQHAISKQAYFQLLCGFFEVIKELAFIFVAFKNMIAVIAPVHHMMKGTEISDKTFVLVSCIH